MLKKDVKTDPENKCTHSKTCLSRPRVTRQSVQVDGEAKFPIYS